MNQVVKRVLAGAVAAAVAAGCCFGGMRAIQSARSTVASVYSIEELTSTFDQEDTRTDGVVSTEQFQSEYLSDTQSVNDVQVKLGQKVKKGDVLFTYDSTLTEIDLKRKEIEVRQKEIEVTDALKELNKLRSYRPGKPIPGSSHTSYYTEGGYHREPVPVYEGLELESGEGTQEQPFRYLWKDSFQFGDELMSAAMQGSFDCYVQFYMDGQDVPLPGPEPDPDPTPEPTPEPTPTPTPSPTPTPTPEPAPEPEPEKSQDSSQDSSAKDPTPVDPGTSNTPGEGSQSSESSGSASQGSGNSGSSSDGSQQNGSQGSQQDGSQQNGSQQESVSDQSGDLAALSSRETFASLETMFLRARPLSADKDSDDGSGSQSDGSGSESDEDLYSVAWVYHCQHTISGYRYVLLSMNVGGVERVVGVPFPPMNDKENPEKQKSRRVKVKDPGIVYTKAELAAMREEQANTVRDAKLEVRQLKVELEKLERELNNSAVYSALDGVVLELNNPKSLSVGEPVLKVSGGGGYLIRGTVSELSLNSVQPGQKVNVSDWSSGGSYEGTVRSVSDYPTTGNSWADGNSNVSYYSFTVSVDGSADLEQNSYVEMSYSAWSGGEEKGTYLLTSFIRREGNKSYILCERKGKLVKKYIRTGRSLWGMYTQVLGGLSPKLYLAFPYGKNVREGSATQHASIDELYGG